MKKQELTLFEEAFVGQFVMVVTNMIQTASIAHEDGSIESAEVPVSMTGFLIGVDNLYYYLGKSPEEIQTAIKKRSINQISLAMDDFDTFINEENPNGVVN